MTTQHNANLKILVTKLSTLFHITSVAASNAILQDGLFGRDGSTKIGISLDGYSIFVVTSDQVALCNSVAINQIWPNQDIDTYAVIAIDASGISGKVVADNVAEETASWHRVIKQKMIEPQYLNLHRTCELNYPYTKLQDLMFKSELTDEDWEIINKWNPLLAAIKRG